MKQKKILKHKILPRIIDFDEESYFRYLNISKYDHSITFTIVIFVLVSFSVIQILA